MISTFADPLNLEASTCTRTLCPNGVVTEVVTLEGRREDLTDEEREAFIAKFPYRARVRPAPAACRKFLNCRVHRGRVRLIAAGSCRIAAQSIWRTNRVEVAKILAELMEEKARLEEAVLSSGTSGKRTWKEGRPPKWMSMAKRRGRQPGSKSKPRA